VTLFGFGGSMVVISAQAEMVERHAANAAVAMAEVNIVATFAMIGATLITGPLMSSRLTWRTALILPVVAMVTVQLASAGRGSRPGAGPGAPGPAAWS
jgi:hypothetical protein